MQIWLYSESVDSLFVLARCIGGRYGGPIGWKCSTQDGDRKENKVSFMLESTKVGDEAYKESKLLANVIKDLLANTEVMGYYDICT